MSYTQSLDSMVQFKKDVIEVLLRDANAKVTFQPGYEALYRKWEAVKGDALINMNADDRLEDFANFVRDEKKRFAAEKLETMELSEQERREWTQAIAREQVLWMSFDDGENFDQLVRADQLEDVEGLVLSETFHSATTDLPEVANEQTALMAVQKLREQNFLIAGIEIENGQVQIEATNAKNEEYKVAVDLDQPLDETMAFDFQNEKGQHTKVDLNPTDERGFGVLEDRLAGEMELVERLNKMPAPAPTEQVRTGLPGMGAAVAAAKSKKKNSPLGIKDYLSETKQQLADNDQFIQNVMQAKLNREARKEHAKKMKEDDNKLRDEANTRAQESMHEAAQYKSEQQERYERNLASDRKRKRGAGILAASLTTLVSAVGSLGTWIVIT